MEDKVPANTNRAPILETPVSVILTNFTMWTARAEQTKSKKQKRDSLDGRMFTEMDK